MKLIPVESLPFERPEKLGPLKAKNKAPFFKVRVSVLTPEEFKKRE